MCPSCHVMTWFSELQEWCMWSGDWCHWESEEINLCLQVHIDTTVVCTLHDETVYHDLVYGDMNHPRTGVIFPPSWTLQQKSSFLQSSSMEEFNLLYFTKIFPKLQQDFAWLKKNWSVGMLLYKLSSYCDAALTIYNEQNSSMYFREILMLLANPAFIKLYSHSEQNNRNSIVGECGQLSACARNYCLTSSPCRVALSLVEGKKLG